MLDTFQKVTQFYDRLLNGVTNFQGIDLSGADLERLMITQDCDFSYASFQEAKLTDAHLLNALMASTIFDQADLTNATLREGKFMNASFCEAILTNANFFHANLNKANFSSAILDQCDFRGADLRGANFKGAHIQNTDFTGAIYSNDTHFDDGINLSNLGMHVLDEVEQSEISAIPDTDTPIERETSQNNEPSELFYRGTRTIIEKKEDKTDKPEVTTKEIWYRGVRTVVEVQQRHESGKTGLNYRGVKQ